MNKTKKYCLSFLITWVIMACYLWKFKKDKYIENTGKQPTIDISIGSSFLITIIIFFIILFIIGIIDSKRISDRNKIADKNLIVKKDEKVIINDEKIPPNLKREYYNPLEEASLSKRDYMKKERKDCSLCINRRDNTITFDLGEKECKKYDLDVWLYLNKKIGKAHHYYLYSVWCSDFKKDIEKNVRNEES